MQLDFWVDPTCPWCWVTARWVVEEVRPARDVEISWQPISLLFKDEPEEGSDYWKRLRFTHGLLRVMEAVRDREGNDGVERFYWEVGSRIHHDRDRGFDPADALEVIGFDRSSAEAFADESRDEDIRKRMSRGIELAGDNVGTPIIAFEDRDGVPRGYFGPVITRVPPTPDSLAMWDALVTMMSVQGFWELKRTRTVRPDFGARP